MATATNGDTAGTCVVDGSAVGMPQLCFDWWGNQIFWLAIALIATFFILSRIALPRIAAVLAERQGTITNDLAAAEDLKAKAVEAEEAYNKALADAEIAAKAAEGEKAIAEIRANALESVKDVAKDTAKELVSAMGGKADARSITSAVTARLKG